MLFAMEDRQTNAVLVESLADPNCAYFNTLLCILALPAILIDTLHQ